VDVEDIEDLSRISSKVIEYYFEAEDFDIESFFCPSCFKSLGKGDIEEGFRKWMDKIKKEDPETYASLISEML